MNSYAEFLANRGKVEGAGADSSIFDAVYTMHGKYSATVIVLSPDAKGYTAWYTKPKNNLTALMFAGAMERREFGNVKDAQQWAQNAARNALKSVQ